MARHPWGMELNWASVCYAEDSFPANQFALVPNKSVLLVVSEDWKMLSVNYLALCLVLMNEAIVVTVTIGKGSRL